MWIGILDAPPRADEELQLLDAPGVGPKTAKLLYKREGVTSRGWVEADGGINTWPAKTLRAWLDDHRAPPAAK